MTARQKQSRQTRFNRPVRLNARQALSMSAVNAAPRQENVQQGMQLRKLQRTRNGEQSMSRLDNALSFHQTALNVRSQRQAVLASNIANADTPNYKARDMDFGSALKGAMQGRAGQPLALATTASRHMAMSGMAMPPALQYRPETQSSVDGNTVDMDVERSAMAENTLQYEASLTFINGLLKSMQAAVTGQG
ncbi:MAG: flagellar basal-body rod protein [Rhodocyclales bacterium]|nr:flagellar basal-body rod protein [Rhodocyclales bacterium]